MDKGQVTTLLEEQLAHVVRAKMGGRSSLVMMDAISQDYSTLSLSDPFHMPNRYSVFLQIALTFSVRQIKSGNKYQMECVLFA